MRKTFAILCALAALGCAARLCHSLGGFLVLGAGPALLLDRWVLRLLPWPSPVSWRKELAWSVAFFALGTAGFYWSRPGVVPLSEAAFRGVAASLALSLLDGLVRLVPLRRAHIALRIASAGMIVLSVPVVAGLHPLHTVPKRTPAALGLPFEEVRFHTADGVGLRGWLIPHAEGRGNVIFCHGHGRNRGHVAALLPTLHALGLNVLAFDFRGHGTSDGHTSTFGRREVRDLVAAAGYLRERFPDRPLLIVGVSLGAAVTIQALPQLPDVAGVWSEGGFGRLDGVVDHYFRCLPAALRRPLVACVFGLAWLDTGLWGSAVNPVESLAGCGVPICFCHGQEDALVPFGEALALHTAHAGPRWCYWAEGASHYNVRQRDRDEYLRRLRAFLAGRLAPGSPPPGSKTRPGLYSGRRSGSSPAALPWSPLGDRIRAPGESSSPGGVVSFSPRPGPRRRPRRWSGPPSPALAGCLPSRTRRRAPHRR